MDSVAFGGEDESKPSTSNGNTYQKLPTRLLDGFGAVNHASIPRKLRSAMKKRGREFVTSPLLTSRKQHLVSTTVDTLSKDGAKKSKLNMKQGHITKDEEEVAETLFALAGMFSDSQQNIDDKRPEMESSATREEGISINAAQDIYPTPREETRKIGSKITLGAAYASNLVNSTAEEVISQTLEARQPDLSPHSSSRSPISRFNLNQSGEQEIHLDRVAAPGFQDGKKCSFVGDKYKDLFHSPNVSATRATNSETHKSCQSARSRLFEDTSCSTQSRVTENKISTKKFTRLATESNNSWKKCSTHIYISRFIKVLQTSDTKEGSLVQPTQPTTCRDAEQQSHVSRNGAAYFTSNDVYGAKKNLSETQNGILLHKRPVRDQQMASETTAVCSAKQEYDFLSLGTGLCRLDNGKSANGAGCFLDPPKQYHMPYTQSQNQPSIFFSLPQNGYSSSLHSHNSASAAQQVQLSQYHSSIVNSNLTSRAAQHQTHYTSGGGGRGGATHLPDWKYEGRDSASVLNYAHTLFPHLHAALGSKYQQLSSSQQQLMLMNTSLPLSNIKRRHNLPLGFERNGDAFNPESMAQLQRPCNQHL